MAAAWQPRHRAPGRASSTLLGGMSQGLVLLLALVLLGGGGGVVSGGRLGTAGRAGGTATDVSTRRPADETSRVMLQDGLPSTNFNNSNTNGDSDTSPALPLPVPSPAAASRPRRSRPPPALPARKPKVLVVLRRKRPQKSKPPSRPPIRRPSPSHPSPHAKQGPAYPITYPPGTNSPRYPSPSPSPYPSPPSPSPPSPGSPNPQPPSPVPPKPNPPNPAPSSPAPLPSSPLPPQPSPAPPSPSPSPPFPVLSPPPLVTPPPSPSPPTPPAPPPSPSPPDNLQDRTEKDDPISGGGGGETGSTDGNGEQPDMPDWPPLPPPPAKPTGAPHPPPPPPPGLAALQGRYEFIGQSMLIGVHLSSIPGTDNFLFMERPSGRHPDGTRTIAGFLNLPTRRFTHLFSPDGLFCAGHSFLDTGDVLIVGGHQANAGYPDGMKSIRTFNRSCTDLQLRKIRDMGWRRWYPSATLLPDGQVLIMGGTQGVGAGTANNPFWELYNPPVRGLRSFAMRPGYLDSSEQVYYPFNYVLPSGLLFSFCGRAGYILDWTNNTWLQQVPRLRGYATTQFPFTGTSLMLGLYPERGHEVEIMLFGGQAERAVRNLSTEATRSAQRLSLGSFDPASRNYSFGPTGSWVGESMSGTRMMGDAVLLPNGKAVILNGARTGLAGDSASGGESRANHPVLFADLYDPDKPHKQRFRPLAASRIARMYHSTACLTTNGTILVAGCDRCARFAVDPGWASDPSPTGKADYRIEIFHPPFVSYPNDAPRIESPRVAPYPPPPPTAPPPPPPPAAGGQQLPPPLGYSNEGVAVLMGYGTTHEIVYSWPDGFGGGSAAGGGGGDVPAGGGGNSTDDVGVWAPGNITRVVLVAPCSCTHSFDMHQRLVGLQILSDTPFSSSFSPAAGAAGGGGGGGGGGGVLSVRSPPDINIAPPGMYMLFLLNGDIYSSAVWVRLARPE